MRVSAAVTKKCKQQSEQKTGEGDTTIVHYDTNVVRCLQRARRSENHLHFEESNEAALSEQTNNNGFICLSY